MQVLAQLEVHSIRYKKRAQEEKNLRRKACQMCKLVMQVDLYKFLEQVSGSGVPQKFHTEKSNQGEIFNASARRVSASWMLNYLRVADGSP